MTQTGTANAALNDRLKEIREKIKEKRSEHKEADKELQSAKEAFANTTIEGKVTESAEFQAAEQAVKKAGELQDEINDLRVAENGVLQLLGDTPTSSNTDPAASMRGVSRADGHNLLANSEGYQRAREIGIFNSTNQFGTVQLGELATREEAAGFFSPRQAYLPGAPAGTIDSTIGITPPDIRGIIQPFLRPLTLLDIIPTGTTDSNVVEYVQVIALPLGAAETAELAMKPELGFETVDATAPVRTIAGWIKMSRQSLDDVAGLASIINTLLPYEVRRRIEAQILAGDGVGQNLKGILNTTGIAEPLPHAGDNAADAILRAMTLVHLSGATPNFTAVNPLTWQELLLMRTDVGGANTGQYILGGPGTMAAATIWGMAITPSLIVDQYSPLVGDSMGAQLLVREGVNVKTSDSDQDDFTRNRVTVLAEGRVAFPIWRPSAFAVAAVPH